MKFEHLNFGVFGLVWFGLGGFGTKNVKFIYQNTQKCNGLERNQMVLKEPYMSLTLTVMPVYLIKKIGVMVLKEFQDTLLFAVC